eukprot:5762960-Prymnesium_polylepis.1
MHMHIYQAPQPCSTTFYMFTIYYNGQGARGATCSRRVTRRSWRVTQGAARAARSEEVAGAHAGEDVKAGGRAVANHQDAKVGRHVHSQSGVTTARR